MCAEWAMFECVQLHICIFAGDGPGFKLVILLLCSEFLSTVLLLVDLSGSMMGLYKCVEISEKC